jgi:hypothetical protein
MSFKISSLIKDRDIKINFYVGFIFFVLILLSFFTAFNLITVIKIRKQIEAVLVDIKVDYNYHPKTKVEVVTEKMDTSSTSVDLIISTSTETTTVPIDQTQMAPPPISNEPYVLPTDVVADNGPDTSPVSVISNIIERILGLDKPEQENANVIYPAAVPTPKIYFNGTSEPFFNSDSINLDRTNLFLDKLVTALTFNPDYSFEYQNDCKLPYCGQRKTDNSVCIKNDCLMEIGGQISYKDKNINLPTELQGKNITNINLSALTSKWIIGFIISEGEQESGYVYSFNGTKLEPLITSTTEQKIITKYSHAGGSISAGGSDNQFMILYSGYEGFAYIYNRGDWQDISRYFGLRVTDGGFKSKIIRGGSDKLATWYVCSDDTSKSKLIKLWQNNTDNIQGAIDLSFVLNGESVVCSYKNDRELNIYGNKYYVFSDNGFKNNSNYYYQSTNLNTSSDRKIISVTLNDYVINARPNSYSIFISLDGVNWQPYLGKELKVNNDKNLSTVYVKADFKTGNSEYSPWFGGMDIISFSTVIKN